MHQEIYEQEHLLPYQVSQTITPATSMHETLFQDIDYIHIIACGSSYHAGLVAQYWFERQRSIVTQVSTASEFRYKKPVITAKTLIIAISQSGETADTIAACHWTKKDSSHGCRPMYNQHISNHERSCAAVYGRHEQSVAATIFPHNSSLLPLAMGTSSPHQSEPIGTLYRIYFSIRPQIAAMAKHIESFKHAFLLAEIYCFLWL